MICAIVITFNPDLERLRVVLSALQRQVDRVQIVDNGSRNASELEALASSIPGTACLPLGGNLGVGAALNRGIETVANLRCEALLLMDQDSIPSPTMVQDLFRGLQSAKAQGQLVAAIGPRFRDRNSGRLSRHVVFAGWHVGRIDCRSPDEPVPVDFLITSGSLIPMDSLHAIGPFKDELFIDHIDTEWVLRARAMGYRAFGDCRATMEHDLGEYRRRFWLGKWRDVPIHKPFRYYYMFRNSLWLARQAYTCAEWKVVDATRLFQIVVFMALFHPQRWAALNMMRRGLLDARRGRMGRRDFA